MPIFPLNQCPLPVLRKAKSLGSVSISAYHPETSAKAAEPRASCKGKKELRMSKRATLVLRNETSKNTSRLLPKNLRLGGRWRRVRSMSGIAVRPLARPQLGQSNPAQPSKPSPGTVPPLRSYGTSLGTIHLALRRTLPVIFG